VYRSPLARVSARPFLNTFGDESVCFQRLTNRNIVVSTTPTAA
jgi:hypothetical protein